MAQLNVGHRKLITINITNTKAEFETWFWNKTANKTDLDIKEKRNSNHKKDLADNKSRTKKAVSSEVHKVGIK